MDPFSYGITGACVELSLVDHPQRRQGEKGSRALGRLATVLAG
jgi:hypothetical protein